MNIKLNKNLAITDMIFFPLKNKDNEKVKVRIVLNDCLILNNMKVIKGGFGHFVAFPNEKGSPIKTYEVCSLSLRKQLQNEILKGYSKHLLRV